MRQSALRAAAALGAGALLLAACSGGSGESGTEETTAGGGGGESGENVTLRWWHNGTGEPLNGFWAQTAADFEAEHPGVTIEITALQNEDIRTKLNVAMQSGDTPEVFPQWGGGELADQVAAGKVKDISELASAEVEALGGSVAGWQVDGKTYGLPYSLGVVGFWYNKALFADAGITEPPTTIDELLEDATKLREAGIEPIAVGAADKWPAAHYWYYAAVRECSQETMEQAVTSFDFTDECWVGAGDVVEKLVTADPFQRGFLAASAQQGAGSSAGLLANGGAAMELMGHWNPGVMSGLTEDGEGLGEDLGWFPFPAVEGGAGDAKAALGGGDGFSCAAEAPDVCAEFLQYLSSVEVQTAFAETGAGLPVTPGAEAGVTDPNMATLLEFRNAAPFVQLYLDVAYGNNVGGALNDAVANQFAGAATPQDVVDAITAAAATK